MECHILVYNTSKKRYTKILTEYSKLVVSLDELFKVQKSMIFYYVVDSKYVKIKLND